MKPKFWLTFQLGLALWASLALAQAMPETWFDIPKNSGGLAVLIDGNFNGGTYSVKDVKTVLDSKRWDSALPLLQQYRLVPGQYELVFPAFVGSTPKIVKVDIKEKMLSVVNISAESGVISSFTYGSQDTDNNFKKLVYSFYKDGIEKTILPMELRPYTNTIHVDTSPPFAVPPPPK